MGKCLAGNNISTVEEREVFFKKVHMCRIDPVMLSEGIKTIKGVIPSVTDHDLNNYFQDCLMNLIGEIFKEWGKLEKKHSDKNQTALSDQDNKVLFYIAGYIIRALEKKYYRIHDKSMREKQIEHIHGLVDNSSEKTFTDKFTTLYEQKNRGGLKKPCDNFFLLVREFEIVTRKVESARDSSLLKSEMKEEIFDSFMVGHYKEMLFPQTSTEEDEQEISVLTLLPDIVANGDYFIQLAIIS
ncbi:hypothetical protein DPMN_063464 [Dreissena polymorpha]|uniref:Uncharacterized protein n=1 Tax=Dreissena polymorpha TaxID=45954 RepID=A0A9D4CB12_DREPO|nr:hypothetical protein DPMN_063463 [Dreissena polymorpha]KAH3720565.1 hypothetical protein DPMN_063464 [Dreissena polymorpha]